MDQIGIEEDPDGEWPLPTAHPAFQRHFTDPVYDDPAGEFAPFGTDEGADLMDEWADRRDEIADFTVADLLGESGFEGALDDLDLPDGGEDVPEPGGPIDAATIVVGAAFTLLRLTGRIDPAGREAALRALGVLEGAYGPMPELERQHADLDAWRG